MGWNDRNPELYESITGLDYGTNRPLDGSTPAMPANWTPPAMPEKCYGCEATGDTINDPIYAGECDRCEHEMCDRCGEVEGDVDGNMYTCKDCLVGA